MDIKLGLTYLGGSHQWMASFLADKFAYVGTGDSPAAALISLAIELPYEYSSASGVKGDVKGPHPECAPSTPPGQLEEIIQRESSIPGKECDPAVHPARNWWHCFFCHSWHPSSSSSCDS